MKGLTRAASQRSSTAFLVTRIVASSRLRRVEIDTTRVVSDDTAKDACVSWIRERTHARRRRLMRNDQQLVPLQLTPSARVPISQFDKIDRPIEFVEAGSCLQFVLTGIDLQQRAGPDERIHREVRHSKIAVSDG